MIGILNIAGHQRKLLSLTTSYSKTVCKKGYPDSLPIAHFFKVSFLTEEGDDFFADWMYGKNKHYQWQKGQWYNGTIVFYDETSYGQEFLRYELTAALATSFRVDYDQEKGMITTLEIFATERIYDHKFIINSEYYAITFDYVKPKEKERVIAQKRKLAIKTIECVSALDISQHDGEKDGVLSGYTYQFNVKEYQGVIPTEEEKRNIKWYMTFTNTEEELVGHVITHKGDSLFLKLPNEMTGKTIHIYAYFSDKEQEGSLELPIVDNFYVIVGFEVNDQEAYEESVSRLVGKVSALRSYYDVGHAFTYIVKNNYIQNFLSLGPIGENTERVYGKGTPDYHISENINLFKISISSTQYHSLLKEIVKVRNRITTGKDNYDILIDNYSCASAAKKLLDTAIPSIPEAESYVLISPKITKRMINPYAWYSNFKKSKWKDSEKILSADENLWQSIMEQCQSENKPKDPYLM